MWLDGGVTAAGVSAAAAAECCQPGNEPSRCPFSGVQPVHQLAAPAATGTLSRAFLA